jgi:Cytochrome C'
MPMLISHLLLATGIVFSFSLGFSAEPPTPKWERLPAKHLPNAVRLHEKVISGGLPETEQAFAELKALGVKTVVSVDGAKPDVELAAKYGLKYIHLPHGYDGVPESRGRELAKVVRDQIGPFYIHCHHGKHRSPAAATIACVANGWIAPANALAVLEFAGTSRDYRGLYESVEKMHPLDAAVLDAMPNEFPEVAKLPPMQEAMVALEHTFDHMKLLAENKWEKLPKHPALAAAHEALLLREHFTEMLRLPEIAERPAQFREFLMASEASAKLLEKQLNTLDTAAAPQNQAEIIATFQEIKQSCVTCHRAFRDKYNSGK